MTDTKLLRTRQRTALWLLPLLLAGCGGGENSTPSSVSAAASPAQAPHTPHNPLETLVQSHHERSGASLSAAQQAVARQLGTEVGQIHAYEQQPKVTFPSTGSTTGMADNARTAAALLEVGLKRDAAPLLRVARDVLDESPRLVSFNFKNPSNYDFYLESTNGAANAAGQLLWDPVYGGLIQGNPRTADHARVCHETVDGFRYTGREEYLRSRGNPARIEISAQNKLSAWLQTQGLPAAPVSKAALFEITIRDQDISSQSMAVFVKDLQAKEREFGPVHHSLFTLDPQALGAATFPSGSRFHVQLQTHFSEAGNTTRSGFFNSTLSCLRSNDLPRPRHTLSAFSQPLRVKHSINATAWNAMKAALNIP